MTEPATPEHTRPSLYMVWDPRVTPAVLSVAPTYHVAAVSAEHVSAMRAAVELDGALSDAPPTRLHRSRRLTNAESAERPAY